ncbi:hypothetical protein [Zafaria sp. J156]|nr:hypothetical protein [Zafaria sp. J156]
MTTAEPGPRVRPARGGPPHVVRGRPEGAAGSAGARWAACAAAVLAVAAAAFHLRAAFTHGHGVVFAAALTAMALACVGCAVLEWLRPSCRTGRLLMSMALGMALAHAALALGVPGLGGSHAVHGGGAGGGAVADASAPGADMLGLAGLELALAWTAAWSLRSARRPAAAP